LDDLTEFLDVATQITQLLAQIADLAEQLFCCLAPFAALVVSVLTFHFFTHLLSLLAKLTCNVVQSGGFQMLGSLRDVLDAFVAFGSMLTMMFTFCTMSVMMLFFAVLLAATMFSVESTEISLYLFGLSCQTLGGLFVAAAFGLRESLVEFFQASVVCIDLACDARLPFLCITSAVLLSFFGRTAIVVGGGH
jgi:hypothetical protein